MARLDATLFPPPRRVRTRLRAAFNTTPVIIDGWNDLTDRMGPAEGMLERFAELHPEVPADRVPWVWEAFLQWVRVRGRLLVLDTGWRRFPAVDPEVSDPRTPSLKVCQPSLAVDRLWQQLAGEDAAWRQLPKRVEVMNRVPVRDHRSRSNLFSTYERAYFDEFALRLPLLFLVDEVLGIADGRLYRGECVVEHCKEKSDLGYDAEPGRTCLHGIPWARSLGVSGGVGG